MINYGEIVCVATDKISFIGKLANEGLDRIELTGLSENEKKDVSGFSFFKIGDMLIVDEGMDILISQNKVIFISTGVKHVPSQ
jgi:hypothetical protein